jgi:hypothetical protein
MLLDLYFSLSQLQLSQVYTPTFGAHGFFCQGSPTVKYVETTGEYTSGFTVPLNTNVLASYVPAFSGVQLSPTLTKASGRINPNRQFRNSVTPSEPLTSIIAAKVLVSFRRLWTSVDRIILSPTARVVMAVLSDLSTGFEAVMSVTSPDAAGAKGSKNINNDDDDRSAAGRIATAAVIVCQCLCN